MTDKENVSDVEICSPRSCGGTYKEKDRRGRGFMAGKMYTSAYPRNM